MPKCTPTDDIAAYMIRRLRSVDLGKMTALEVTKISCRYQTSTGYTGELIKEAMETDFTVGWDGQSDLSWFFPFSYLSATRFVSHPAQAHIRIPARFVLEIHEWISQ